LHYYKSVVTLGGWGGNHRPDGQ